MKAIANSFTKLEASDRTVPVARLKRHAPTQSTVTGSAIENSLKKQRKLNLPRIITIASAVGMLPLGIKENKGLGFLIHSLCGDVSGISRRSITREMKSLYTEKKEEISRDFQAMLEFSQLKDSSNPQDRKFRGLEQDVWSNKTSSYQGLVMQQVGKQNRDYN